RGLYAAVAAGFLHRDEAAVDCGIYVQGLRSVSAPETKGRAEERGLSAYRKRIISAPVSSKTAPATRPAVISRTATPMKPIRSAASPAINCPATARPITAAAPMRGVSSTDAVT